MAFSLYLFTRGEGPLKNTSDLFQQAELFNEEGTRLFKVIKDFAQQVVCRSLYTNYPLDISGPARNQQTGIAAELGKAADRLPKVKLHIEKSHSWKISNFQQGRFRSNNFDLDLLPWIFQVDNVIHDTKALMNAVSKVVTASFICATKVTFTIVTR